METGTYTKDMLEILVLRGDGPSSLPNEKVINRFDPHIA
jgi:hypothetical protein